MQVLVKLKPIKQITKKKDGTIIKYESIIKEGYKAFSGEYKD